MARIFSFLLHDYSVNALHDYSLMCFIGIQTQHELTLQQTQTQHM